MTANQIQYENVEGDLFKNNLKQQPQQQIQILCNKNGYLMKYQLVDYSWKQTVCYYLQMYLKTTIKSNIVYFQNFNFFEKHLLLLI